MIRFWIRSTLWLNGDVLPPSNLSNFKKKYIVIVVKGITFFTMNFQESGRYSLQFHVHYYRFYYLLIWEVTYQKRQMGKPHIHIFLTIKWRKGIGSKITDAEDSWAWYIFYLDRCYHSSYQITEMRVANQPLGWEKNIRLNFSPCFYQALPPWATLIYSLMAAAGTCWACHRGCS